MKPDSFQDRVEAGLARYKERKKKFDPEGDGYDYETAIAEGMKPDETGHWGSRAPISGQMVKGRKHKTWGEAVKGEEGAGYEIYRDDKTGLYFSKKKK